MIHNSVQLMTGLTSVASGDMGALLSYPATVSDSFLIAQQKALISDLEGMQSLIGDLTIVRILLDLSMSVEERFSNLQLAFNQIMSSTGQVHSLAHEIRMAERQARWAAAKATGAEFVVIDGEAVTMPVNTVYNRQYDLTKKRYAEALADAKYLSYVARVAIEQRIGRRLGTLHSPVGPVEAPSLWADDVCRLTGVDYESMREADVRHFAKDYSLVLGAVGSGASSPTQIDPAVLSILVRDVSPFVGDYVAKLENFVDYYNLSFPFHEGDDSVVLSIRDHVLGPREACSYPAPNLLLHSHSLHRQEPTTSSASGGWLHSGCDETKLKCVEVAAGDVLGSPVGSSGETFAPVPPVGVGETGATWLRDVTPGEADPETSGSEFAEVEGVSQVVRLDATGSYLLSWWDQARSRLEVGAFPGDQEQAVAYRVEVREPGGSVIASVAEFPHMPTVSGPLAAGSWSERRRLSFTVSEPGDYAIVFLPSHLEQDLGSVVVANVQLESTLSSGADPGPYFGTGSTRNVVARCASLPAQEFRSAFERRCDASSDCYYELIEPLTIDTGLLSDQNGYLGGLFARGNYNFRHITVAVNVAGTGVVDCVSNPQASCYGMGTIRYTLEHDAFRSDVIAGVWRGVLEKQSFNFGTGAIRRGQALAAERFITMPIGNSDAALLSQPGVTKVELMGRPLGGTYRLRVWENPEMVWDRVEDIQLVLKYRYWSSVNPGT